jgi:hypothetical protein
MRARGAIGTTPLLAAAAALSLLACGGSGDGHGEAGGPQACGDCHAQQVAAWENFSSHRALFDCGSCHAESMVSPGPGHRSVSQCADCHSEASHPVARVDDVALPGDGASQQDRASGCARCHDPHGSTNARLIRERITAGGAEEASIVFTSFFGRADGSYAELSAGDGGMNGREAGSGPCEVCHDGTRVYDRSGKGPAGRHPTERCTLCHDHARGFAARDSGSPE